MDKWFIYKSYIYLGDIKIFFFPSFSVVFIHSFEWNCLRLLLSPRSRCWSFGSRVYCSLRNISKQNTWLIFLGSSRMAGAATSFSFRKTSFPAAKANGGWSVVLSKWSCWSQRVESRVDNVLTTPNKLRGWWTIFYVILLMIYVLLEFSSHQLLSEADWLRCIRRCLKGESSILLVLAGH